VYEWSGVESGEWRVESGEWRVESGEWSETHLLVMMNLRLERIPRASMASLLLHKTKPNQRVSD